MVAECWRRNGVDLAALGFMFALDEPMPAMPFIAAGYLLPDIDRVRALLRGTPCEA